MSARAPHAVLVATLALATACRADAPRATRDGVAGPVSLRSPDTLPVAASSDVAVLALVDAMNRWDVADARLARQKAGAADVKRFAAALANAHPQKVTDRSVQPTDAAALDLLRPLRDAQRETMTRLAATPPGTAFDRAFVATHVARHERILGTLDALDTAARSDDVRALLQRTRAEVERHLREARALQRRVH